MSGMREGPSDQPWELVDNWIQRRGYETRIRTEDDTEDDTIEQRFGVHNAAEDAPLVDMLNERDVLLHIARAVRAVADASAVLHTVLRALDGAEDA